MGEGLISRRGGGIAINGLIERYRVASGESISAGDFVKFTTSQIIEGTPQLISEAGGKYPDALDVVALDDSRVFVAYSVGTDNHLYGTLLTINDTSIIINSTALLSDIANSGAYIAAVRLNTDKVFIVHGSSYMTGMIVSISGTALTASTDTQLSSNTFSTYIRATALDNSRVFICTLGIAFVATVSGNTIAIGTSFSFAVGYYSGLRIMKLDNSRILVLFGIMHASGSTVWSYLNGRVLSVSGSQISSGSQTQLSSNYGSGLVPYPVMTKNRVYVFFLDNGSTEYHYAYCLPLNISGYYISTSNYTNVYSAYRSGSVITAFAISDNELLVMRYGDSSATVLYRTIVTISDTISAQSSALTINRPSNNGFCGCVLPDKRIVFIHRESSTYHSRAFVYLLCNIAPVTAADTIYGVAKNNAADTQSIDIYIPDHS